MSKQSKPRVSDVARWVAVLAAPAPTGYGSSLAWYAKREAARVKLAARGLDAQGNPKPAPVAS